MAGRAKEKASSGRRTRQLRSGRRRFRLIWAVAIVGVSVYLYYRPIASYLETRNDLATSRADVESLRLVKAELELRLATSTSLEATQREARRIGYVLPGEQLFVVKGIPAWRRAQRTLRDDG